MLSNLGAGEIVVIAIILLFMFGTNKFNELARSLGQSVKEIKKIAKDIKNEP